MNEELAERVASLSWPQFDTVARAIGVDPREFSESMAPAVWVQRLTNHQTSLKIDDEEIEYAINNLRYKQSKKSAQDTNWLNRSIPERITGKKETFLPVAFLEKGMFAARSVCRVDIGNDAEGTGFLISESLLLTNNHVMPSLEVARRATFLFDYQMDISGVPIPERIIRFKGDSGNFWTDLNLDWTVVRLDNESEPPTRWLNIANYVPIIGSSANIIGHPQGRAKKVSLYHNEITGCNETQISYKTDTDEGSSGSPVFDDQWDVIALHRGGDKKLFLNHGILAAPIRKALVKHGLLTGSSNT